MQRRLFLNGAGLSLAAAGVAAKAQALPAATPPATTAMPAVGAAGPGPLFAAPAPLMRMKISVDRILELNVCTRPFRATGPRIEAEKIGRKTVIHNYGHGGSGWSLSWGSGRIATELAQATGEKHIAVIGAGAIGLTTALMLQRAGFKVRIYAKERMPLVRSAWATGGWTPDSRVCSAEHSTPEFEARWESMARFSFRMYTNLLGLAGDPIQWRDHYALSDTPPRAPGERPPATVSDEPDYPHLNERLLPDLIVRPQTLEPGQHPFRVPYVRRSAGLTFNISGYSRLLMNDFLLLGGQIETVEFASPRDFAKLKEKTIVNCTGYGARALMGDESIIPVRGQNVKLIPQPEVTYGVSYGSQHVTTAPRNDCLLVQANQPGDFNNPDITPDRASSEAAVLRLAAAFA